MVYWWPLMIARSSTSVAPGYTASELKVAADAAQKQNQRKNAIVLIVAFSKCSGCVCPF